MPKFQPTYSQCVFFMNFVFVSSGFGFNLRNGNGKVIQSEC